MNNKRNTKQKKMIIDYLEKNRNKHLTINEIVDGLESKIGTTTVYRKINELIEEGMVNKIPITNTQGYCYQYVHKNEECKNHYHLVCKDCEKVTHFDSAKVLEFVREAKNEENFEIDIPKITFLGTCKDCKNK